MMQSVSLDVEEVFPSINFICPPSRIELKIKFLEKKGTGDAIALKFESFRKYYQNRSFNDAVR